MTTIPRWWTEIERFREAFSLRYVGKDFPCTVNRGRGFSRRQLGIFSSGSFFSNHLLEEFLALCPCIYWTWGGPACGCSCCIAEVLGAGESPALCSETFTPAKTSGWGISHLAPLPLTSLLVHASDFLDAPQCPQLSLSCCLAPLPAWKALRGE